MSSGGGDPAVLGNKTWAAQEKVNGELFSLTYGALVSQLMRDYGADVAQVNAELEQMGFNIGVRLVDEFMARSGARRCSSFQESAQVVAKVGFKMFLGVDVDVSAKGWNREKTSYVLEFSENPLTRFVELPAEHASLLYSNMLCGVVRGALEMVQLRVECEYVSDTLRGDDISSIRVTLKEVLRDLVPVGEDDD